MKPPLICFGSKVTVADEIVSLLPQHSHYVEPFSGSLAVLFAKPSSPMETVNDLDQAIMLFWQILRERPDDLIRVCTLTPHSRFEASLRLDEDGIDELEKARRVWIQFTQTRTGVMRNTGWKHFEATSGSSTSMPDRLAAYVGRMAPAAARLAEVSLECRPALDVIRSYGRHEDVLLFCDPPYLASTRNGRNYRHEMATEASHRELAEALTDCAAAVVLSGYDSPLYDALYDGWERHEISAMTTQGGTHGRRTEVLWSNRPLGRQQGLFEVMAS